MPADLTREEIERLDDEYQHTGWVSVADAARLLQHALSEPTRSEATKTEGRQEGYRAGVEAALAEFDVEVYSETFRHGSRMRRRFDSEVRDAIRALSPAPAEPTWTPTHRHYKGGLYREIERLPDRSDDGARPEGIVVYEGEDGRRHSIDARRFDGMVAAYALDGAVSPTGEYARRFEPINPAPAEEQRILAQRRFRNELAREIRITIEGPSSISENTLTPAEAAHLRDALVEAIPAPAEAPTTPSAASDEWIEWKGGECPPAAVDVKAGLRFRDGREAETMLIRTYRWQHIGAHDDIIAYRIVQPAEASAPVADYMIACGQHADSRRVAEERVAALEAENAALKARNVELEDGLRPFAVECAEWVDQIHLLPNETVPEIKAPSDDAVAAARFTLGDLRRARALLQGGPDAG